MPRKGANIYKRKDGRWEARFVKSIDPDGRKHYGSVYGSTYAQAKEKQLLCIQSVSPLCSSVSKQTLSDIMEEWLLSITHSVKKSTFQKYQSVINNHIASHQIGRIQVRYVSQSAFAQLADEALTIKSLSPKTVNDIFVVIGLALKYAEEIYSIKKPKLPRIKESTKEMRVLTLAEQKQLERYLYENMSLYCFGVLLSLYTGIRVGELCALQWEDIDDDHITINKTMHRIKENGKTIIEITEPKTQSSVRRIPLPAFLKDYVNKYKGKGSLLKNNRGKPVEPRLMQMTFEKIITECGLPKTNYHALRHTFATRCIEAGFDVKSLSEILGHSDVKTTLNKYVHSSYEQKQKNMELLHPLGKD